MKFFEHVCQRWVGGGILWISYLRSLWKGGDLLHMKHRVVRSIFFFVKAVGAFGSFE